jgi:hypothetical protein
MYPFRNYKYEYLTAVILCSIIAVFIFTEIFLDLTPPIVRDVLIHHLAIPKLWLKHGGFYDLPWAVFSYYPMNVDLLYLIPLYFGNDIIPNFIHLSFGLGTAWLIYSYLRSRFNRMAGLSGVVILITTPIIVRMSTTAYVDLGLVFFTTACILAFIQWRSGEYKKYGWLLISSLSLGFALGTKYNAMIVWFFVSLSVVFVYSRDTNKPWIAIKYGALFFIIALSVFSPWLIKNAILTGNPIYPLFHSIFNAGYFTDNGGTHSIVPGSSSMSMFKMRELLYGESIWETLLIPIRFFFQGQDNSDRYFEGVLTPLLIIGVPFAFRDKSKRSDMLIFLSFSVFFILMAFFLNQIRVRYILPVIPFLIILTVSGLINFFSWLDNKGKIYRRLFIYGLLTILIFLMANNVIYLYKHFRNIQPVNYVLGKESRDEFISRHDRSYPAVMYINRHTPENARIKLILLSGRGYYLERVYDEDQNSGMNTIRGLVTAAGNDVTFDKYLHSLGCTYLLVRYDLFRQFLYDNFPPEDVRRLFARMGKETEIVYYGNGYAVLRLIK